MRRGSRIPTATDELIHRTLESLRYAQPIGTPVSIPEQAALVRQPMLIPTHGRTTGLRPRGQRAVKLVEELEASLLKQARTEGLVLDQPGPAEVLEIQAALSGAAPVLTGRLAASWVNGESFVIPNGDGTYTLDSMVPYARINDLGGNTGRDGKTHIHPSYYVASAEARVGLQPGTLRWVDGKLSGAGGVGPRGVDLPATNALLRMVIPQPGEA